MPQDFYQNLRAAQLAAHADLRKEHDRFALKRLVAFVGLLVLLVLAFSVHLLAGLVAFLAFVAVAYRLVRHHDAIGRAAERAEVRAKLADRELAALNHDFRHFDGADDLLDPAHPYALDLDIFGRHSLFQFLNRTVTAPGRRLLADSLLAPQPQEVLARTRVQSRALSTRPEWTLEFRTLGEGLGDTLEQQARLGDWLARPQVIDEGWVRPVALVTPLLAVVAVAAMFFVTPWLLPVVLFLPAILLYRRYAGRIATEHAYTSAMGKLLSRYADLLKHLESLPEQRDAVLGAEPAIRRLSYLIGQLDVRYNPFSLLLEISGAWSIGKVWKLDRWRERYRDDLPRWLAAVAETDALISWATLRYNHPGWADPEFTDEPVLEATELGHPLLNPVSRVTNNIGMRTDGHIHLVTGSNMAGKSTWLRTVGVNLVLAQAGGPVCARHLRSRPLQVWTSMRTQDDLSEATSSFYAELKRLQAIITAVSRREHVFFLLDEILKGTNSRDRHTGSRALIRQLIRDQGAGIIATHDLELAELENEPGSRVENYAMEVQTQGDDLVFDYKLHPGVCESFNATALMARMGIAIPEEEISLRHD